MIWLFISSLCSHEIFFSTHPYVLYGCWLIIRHWRRLWGENANTTTDLGAGDYWRTHLCFKVMRKNSVQPPAVNVDSALNKWIWWYASNVSFALSQKTNWGGQNKHNAGKSQEWLLCIKGIFTFRPGAKLPRAKMSRSEGAELENHTFRSFFADLMLRFTLPFTPGESQSNLHHYTSISSPFIISHRRRSHEKEKKESRMFSKRCSGSTSVSVVQRPRCSLAPPLAGGFYAVLIGSAIFVSLGGHVKVCPAVSGCRFELQTRCWTCICVVITASLGSIWLFINQTRKLNILWNAGKKVSHQWCVSSILMFSILW